MRPRRLRALFSQIMLIVAPVPLTASCGGSTEVGTGGPGGDGNGTGGSSTGGFSTTGGDTSTGGSPTGGSPSTGGSGYGGGPSGCQIAPSANCSVTSQGVVSRDCISPDGTATAAECALICNGAPGCCASCVVDSVSSATATVTCEPMCFTGRRPSGWSDDCGREAPEEFVLGTYYARAARLEAAAVVAFRELRRELERLRAPRSLLRAASRAARDEVRHTRTSTALARRFGGAADTDVRIRTTQRSIEALATENAVEGCVRESYGALVASWQAERAREPAVRAAMRKIAREETRHAELGWTLHAWFASRLDPAARTRVASTARAALLELATELEAAPHLELVERAGLPAPAVATRLLAELDRALVSKLAAS